MEQVIDHTLEDLKTFVKILESAIELRNGMREEHPAYYFTTQGMQAVLESLKERFNL